MIAYPSTFGGGSGEQPIHSNNNPTVTENLPVGTVWINDDTGEIFVCIDDTTDHNKWQGQIGTFIPSSTLGIVDIFGDNSGVVLYQFDSNADDTGGQYNGTPHSITYENGKFDKCSDYNGNDSYVDTNFKTSNLNNTYSISAWVKRLTTNTQDAVYTETKATNNSYGTHINFKGDGTSISAGHFKNVGGDFDNVGGDISGYISSMTDWIHIVFTRDNGNEHKLYINGQLFNTVSCANVTNGSSYTGKLGANPDYTAMNRYLKGSIDQVRIFNRPLTDSEANQLYNEH